MEIAGPVLIGCATAVNGFLTYILSKSLKSDEEKIKQGGEQLNRILKEYDSHMKYIYNLQIVCDEYRLAWKDMYSRQFLKNKNSFLILNKYFLLKSKIDKKIYEEIENNIQQWKSKESRLKIIKNILKKNNVKYKLLEGFQQINEDGLLFFIYSFLSIIAFLKIRKKNEDQIHASFSNENDYLQDSLNKISKLLNINNNNEISVPINLQNSLGENFIKNHENSENGYKVISFLEFKDKIHNQYLDKNNDLSNIITFDEYYDIDENEINKNETCNDYSSKKSDNKRNNTDENKKDNTNENKENNTDENKKDNIINENWKYIFADNIVSNYKKHKHEPFGGIKMEILKKNIKSNTNDKRNTKEGEGWEIRKESKDQENTEEGKGGKDGKETNNHENKKEGKEEDGKEENEKNNENVRDNVGLYKIWMIQNPVNAHKWLEEEYSLIKHLDNNFFKNFKKLYTDCYRLQDFFSIQNERTSGNNCCEKEWINALVCLMYTTILNIFNDKNKSENLSELHKIFKDFILILCYEKKIDFEIKDFEKDNGINNNIIKEMTYKWLIFVEKKIHSEKDFESKIKNNFCHNKKEYKFFEEIIYLNNKSHLSNVSVHKLLYKDTYQFQKNIRWNGEVINIQMDKKSSNSYGQTESNFFIHDNILRYQTVGKEYYKVLFLDQSDLIVEKGDGYIKLYRHKKDLVFIKTKHFDLNKSIDIFSDKDDEIYTRKYLYLFPSKDKFSTILNELRSIKKEYTNYREKYTEYSEDYTKNELHNKINNIQYLSDPFKDEEIFLKIKKKIVSEYKTISYPTISNKEKQLDIFFILRGIKTNYMSENDREVLDFFKNIFYEFFIKHIHRVFKEIGDICCTIVKESTKLIKKDIESRKNLLKPSSNSSIFKCCQSTND
jgi:hypothetical protein